MHQSVTLRALAAAQSLLLLLRATNAQSTSTPETTTTTLFSTATVATSTIVVTLTGFPPSSGVVPPPTGVAPPAATATGTMAYTGDGFPSAILNSTNYYRAQHQANPLTWDTSLAQYAQSYAEKCLWQHSGGPHGENLAEGYSSPSLSIDAWAGEEKKYDYAKPKFSDSTGHYTQLVWKNSTTVGCGAVQCDSSASNGVKGWFLVCEYDPPGNVDGEFGEEVGKSGEGKDGAPGLGGVSGRRESGGVLKVMGALVAAYALLALLV